MAGLEINLWRIIGWDKTVPVPGEVFVYWQMYTSGSLCTGKGFDNKTLTQVQGLLFCERINQGLLKLESWSKGLYHLYVNDSICS